jgi:hypothetical protein
VTPRVTAGGDRVRFEVQVVPRSARTAVGGRRGGVLVVRVTAPPVGGAANEAVARAVAEALGVPHGTVLIERGGRGRRKLLSAPASARPLLESL